MASGPSTLGRYNEVAAVVFRQPETPPLRWDHPPGISVPVMFYSHRGAHRYYTVELPDVIVRTAETAMRHAARDGALATHRTVKGCSKVRIPGPGMGASIENPGKGSRWGFFE